MRLPIVTEIVQRREPVVHDTFIDDLHVHFVPPVPPAPPGARH